VTYQHAFDVIAANYPELEPHQVDLLALQHIVLSDIEILRQVYVQRYGLEDRHILPAF
jgi:hypothetical protein